MPALYVDRVSAFQADTTRKQMEGCKYHQFRWANKYKVLMKPECLYTNDKNNPKLWRLQHIPNYFPLLVSHCSDPYLV